PAILLAAAAVHMLLFLRERPAEQEDESRFSLTPLAPAAFHPIAQPAGRTRFVDTILATLSNPALWILALSLALLDACRYGFQDWGLAQLKEVQEAHVGVTAAKYAVLPAGGILGALFAGWVTDRFFGGRRAPAGVGLL